jgi:glutamyl-tRNA synthetase
LEDLDGERACRTFIDLAQRDLEWLGLDWDGLPRIQSEGLDRIRETAYDLERQERAYPCICTRGDLRAAIEAPQQGTQELRYTGRCRGVYRNIADAESRTGQRAALRFRVAPGNTVVHDELWGATAFDVQAQVGDFLILRRDKSPSYQLSVVVDDAFDGVTEVVRGDDLLPSAARQQLLGEALNLPQERYYHVPLVVDTTGRRLAKRCDDLGLSTLREVGVDPRAIVEWVARSAGISELTRPTARDVLPLFDWKRLPLSPVVFDEPTQRSLLSSR